MADRDGLYRAAAVLALGSAVAALVVMCAAVRVHPWSMLGILVAWPAAVIAGWHMVSRRGWVRVLAGLLVLVAVAAPVLHVLAHQPRALLITMLLFGFSMASARLALRPVGRRPRRAWRRHETVVTPVGRAVLLLNPHAGNGKAAGFELAELARRGRVDVVPLGPDDDLGALAETAADEGAAILGVAGGDGSMAAVAAVAARHGLPFVCVPAGTRNHLALDLGLDPNDPAHAITAFRNAVPFRIDLAEVNGQVFVNNVSLGIYATIVRSRHYRRSKLWALLAELPALIGPDSAPFPLRFSSPDGTRHRGTHALLISNNPYRLGGLGHDAWRPRLSSGSLGVLTVRVDDGLAAARLALMELFGRGYQSPGYSRWSTGMLTVDADAPILAGRDGEPVTLQSPLRFTSLPGALTVYLPAAPRQSSTRRLVGEAQHLIRAAVSGDHAIAPVRPTMDSQRSASGCRRVSS